jgi:hypothetical protein
MSLKKKIKPLFFALSLILGGFVFNSNVFAFDLNGCNPISNPLNLCQEQTYYPAVDIKLTPYGTEYFVTLNNGVFSSVPDCSDNVYSMLIKNTSTSQDLVFIKNGQYGFCEYGQDINAYNPNIPDGDYFYELYTGTSWGNRVAHGYIRLYKIDGVWTAQSSYSDGACGIADNNLPTTIPIPDGEACASGTVDNMHDYYTFDGIVFAWNCLGSGGGISVSCNTLPYPNPVNGVCGTANNTTVYNQPEESEKCADGATNSTTLITLTGWSWTCEGLYGGTDALCSATYGGGGTPPTIPDTAPIPTPTDCDSYSGIDKILCNLGNIIQGMFLPSTEKLTELQSSLNSVGNVFPFNYLRVIGNTFSNMTITQGSLTITMWGNTETINSTFWDLPIFENIRLFSTILILLMFTFWAVGYIKHFFK